MSGYIFRMTKSESKKVGTLCKTLIETEFYTQIQFNTGGYLLFQLINLCAKNQRVLNFSKSGLYFERRLCQAEGPSSLQSSDKFP